MIAEACARLSPMCPPLAEILRDCCIQSPDIRPSSSSILSRLEALLSAQGSVTAPVSLVPPATSSSDALVAPLPSEAGAEASFPSVDVISAMERLELNDAMDIIGTKLLSSPAVTQSGLVGLLTGVGVKVGQQAKLLRTLSTPTSPVSLRPM